MAKLTLDSIRDAADKKYGSLEVDLGDKVVELKNPLRLSKEDRARLSDLKQPEDDDADPLDYFGALYEILAGKAGAKALLEALGEDIPLHMEVVSNLNSETELGEASPSQD